MGNKLNPNTTASILTCWDLQVQDARQLGLILYKDLRYGGCMEIIQTVHPWLLSNMEENVFRFLKTEILNF